MHNWYEKVREQTEYIFQKIIQHPFIAELITGTLPPETFRFYIQQDSLYLAEYKKILSMVGVKCRDMQDTQFYLESATGIIHVENALHQLFLHGEEVNVEISPTCQLYTSYMASTVQSDSVEVGAAAVLPCFTIYKEVGDYILAHQQKEIENPYQNWIDTYGGEEFAQSVARAVDIANRFAQKASGETLQRMETAFVKASKLEWMFWDSAYQQEKWKI